MNNRTTTYLTAFSFAFLAMFPVAGHAQDIPGAADVGRVKTKQDQFSPKHEIDTQSLITGDTISTDIHAGANEIQFNLESVKIVGATVSQTKNWPRFMHPMLLKKLA
jgi:hypothetical protein